MTGWTPDDWWLPTTEEVAKAVLKVGLVLTTAYTVFLAGSCHQAKYQMQALSDMEYCERLLNDEVERVEGRIRLVEDRANMLLAWMTRAGVQTGDTLELGVQD